MTSKIVPYSGTSVGSGADSGL